jgi:hypothetical protein
MSDVIFIAVMIAFFVLCALYVNVCDRLIGTDDQSIEPATDSETAVVAAAAGADRGVTA